MYKFIIAIIFFTVCFFTEAKNIKILIDTDGAADDLRGISMMLANPQMEITGITSSEGALMPDDITEKLHLLLRYAGREEIPVGTGRNLYIEIPKWRSQSALINWGDSVQLQYKNEDATGLITGIMESEPEKFVFVCLGSLTNLNDVLKEKPYLKRKIDRVVWYNDNEYSGVNYGIDEEAAKNIITQSGIKLEIISGVKNTFAIDTNYINELSGIDSPYAQLIVKAHQSGNMKQIVQSGHMKAWDDLVALYLYSPEIFQRKNVSEYVSIYSLKDGLTRNRIFEHIIKLLEQK